jgi:hypothetical protein
MSAGGAYAICWRNWAIVCNRRARYGREGNTKTGTSNLRTARTVAKYQEEEEQVISVDTRKKELIGEFKNAGGEWQPEGAGGSPGS